MKKFNRVPLEQLLGVFSYWREVLKSNSIGQIFTIPFADASFRSAQFKDWAFEKYAEQYAVISLDEVPLTALAETIQKTQTPVLLLAGNHVFGADGIALIKTIERASLEANQGILVFHEGFQSQLKSQRAHFPTTFFQYQSIFPLHTEETVSGFITNLSKDLNTTVDAKTADQIYTHCGGMLWLVSACVRELAQGKNLEQILISDDLTEKATMIWQALPELHQRVLAGFEAAPEITQELGKYGFYLDYRGTVPGFIQNCVLAQNSSGVHITENSVQFMGKELNDNFTNSELKLLHFGHQHLDEVMSRDAWGQAYWQNSYDQNYSDWALDKVMSRMRARLQKANLPLRLLTKRGKGYVLTERKPTAI